MDIHRSRFVPYPTSAITAIAFSRANDNGLPTGISRPALKLAIGRQNGEIEIWNPLGGNWIQEAIFSGESKSIDGLAWTREPDEKDTDGQVILGQHRLFSIASSPAVVEWDLERGRPKRLSTGNFSEVWCFATQPRQSLEEAKENNAPSQEIVAGCGDGTIVLLSTADNDLEFKRFVARVSGKKARCVSITYQTQHRILAGFMDSTIRIFDTRNGSTVRQMSLGAGLPQAPKNVIVWQVKCLANGDVVTGDSNGEIVFWDGRSYTLTQRLKGHESECLDLIVSADGQAVISGSNDGRLAVYRQSTGPNGRRSWMKTHHRKTHDSQVKAMSAFDSRNLSVVVSGGDDIVPMLTPLREYGKENQRFLPTLPQSSPVTSSRHARLLVSWWDKSISIWRFARRLAVDASMDAENPRKLVAKLALDTQDHIRDVAISDDGRTLAACTSTGVKVFQLRRKPGVDALSIRKMDVPKSFETSGARLLRFSPDGKWLAAVHLDSEVHVVRIAPVSNKRKYLQIVNKVVELERHDRRETPQSGFKTYERTITQLAFASDSSVLVSGDLSGYLDSWVLEGHEDLTAPMLDISKEDPNKGGSDDNSDSSDSSDEDDEVCVFYGQHWTDNPAGHLLPKLESAPVVLSFRPSKTTAQHNGLVNGNPGIHSTRHNPHAHSHELPKGQHMVWLMTAQHQMYEFDVLAGRLSDWSRRNPTAVLPEDFAKLNDRAKGVVWDISSQRERLWLFGTTWMFMFNVGTDLSASTPHRKRKAESDGQIAKRQKTNSGAGSKVLPSHREGQPGSIKRYEDGEWTDMALDKPIKPDDDLDQDEDEDMDARLRLTRVKSMDSEGKELVNGDSQAKQQRTWWCTFKYRPILGVVPLEDSAATDEDKPLEVVVVERPLWDARKAQ